MLLMLHINMYMFLPQCPEMDIFDKSGQQTEDINTVIELISVELGYDKVANDEDDDNGNDMMLTKGLNFTFTQQVVQLIHEQSRDYILLKKTHFPSYQNNFHLDTVMEVATPPPDAVA